MRPFVLVGAVAIACAGCGLLPGGGGLGSLLPTADLWIAGTPAFPGIGTFEAGALLSRPTIAGSVLDQYGQAMPGVVICYGPAEAGGSAVAATDAGGAYSAVLSSDDSAAEYAPPASVAATAEPPASSGP